ncbi:MAG TPA: 4-hydroxybenzoate octaprenyltransferase [Sphingomicrobium sp.]|jgi:4-hydroxybenzoate polyprenyltransferase
MQGADIVPDSERRGLIGVLPPQLRPFASLMRLDRPIGSWLLFWPCAWGLALSGTPNDSWSLLLWFGLGAFAMRSAGCVYNDIVDRDLDRQVERTRLRPIASGRVSVRAAWILLAVLLLAGLSVWWRINIFAKELALCTLPLVALYPFAKRVTWWPQAVLGVIFASGAPVAYAAGNGMMFKFPLEHASDWGALAFLYAGSVAWVIGYDTLYAIQDVEDDALVGVKSSARRLGDKAPAGVAIFYLLALLLWGAAIWSVRPDWVALLALVPAGLHLINQAMRADPKDGAGALALFRSNRTCGLLIFLGLLVVGLSAR